MTTLEFAAHWAAVLTACVATLGYGRYLFDQYRKRKKLEAYLKNEKSKGADKGQRSILHLMANVGMTEAELLQASFRSRHIERRIAADAETDRAAALLLAYSK